MSVCEKKRESHLQLLVSSADQILFGNCALRRQPSVRHLHSSEKHMGKFPTPSNQLTNISEMIAQMHHVRLLAGAAAEAEASRMSGAQI